MKLFGFNNKDTEITITLLNKKIVIEKIDEIHRSILLSWKYDGVSEELLSIFKLLYYNPKFWNKANKDIWLVYICCLLQKQDNQKALKVLFRYTELFGVENIEKFLPAAKFALQNGIKSAAIESAAELFDLFEMNKNNCWLDSLKDKTIAVVGNGTQLTGLKKGAEIDSHDVVIRFNKFRTEGFEEDCGKKTSVWVTQTLPPDGFSGDCADFIVLNQVYSYWNNKFDVNKIKKIIKNNRKVYILNPDITTYARDCLKADFYTPTTGCSLILELYKRFKSFDNIDFYGFGFLNEKFKPLDHYYTQVSKRHQMKAQAFHCFEQESRFLKQLVQNKSFVE